MRLIQFVGRDGQRGVGAITGTAAPRQVKAATSVHALALEAQRAGRGLVETVEAHGLGEEIDYDALFAEHRILPPLDNPHEPARTVVALTGLTHLGSAQSRDSMHAKLQASDADLTDSMKMFKIGIEGGKPAAGAIGAQPEWGWKGDGSWIVAPGEPLELPGYAGDAGEEAEITGLYVIGDGGEVLRVGYALGNECSDHVMERRNYLYLAHSKLRASSFGPELLVGELPQEVTGTARILRGGQEVWRGQMISGDANMCHSIANLEQHHFKYERFRRPGDVHIYYFGASALSCTAGVTAAPGDVFEIESPLFGRALVNPLKAGKPDTLVKVKAL